MARRDIYERLDLLKPISWTGTAFRHSAAAYGHAQVLNGEGARRHGGRWNPPDSFRTVYCSLEVRTVVEEARRTVHPDRWQDLVATHVLWAVRVSIDNLIDLRSPRSRMTVGLPEPFDDRISREVTREIGGAAYYVRYKGLLVPSAAAPGTTNLVVFPDNFDDSDIFEMDAAAPRAFASFVD